MDWDELTGLFIDERVDMILRDRRGKAGLIGEFPACLTPKERERIELALAETAEQEAADLREVYQKAFLDGLYVGFQAYGGHGREYQNEEE